MNESKEEKNTTNKIKHSKCILPSMVRLSPPLVLQQEQQVMQQVGECVMTHREWRECGLMGCPLTHPLRVMTEEEDEEDVAAALLTVRWRRSIGRSTDVL